MLLFEDEDFQGAEEMVKELVASENNPSEMETGNSQKHREIKEPQPGGGSDLKSNANQGDMLLELEEDAAETYYQSVKKDISRYIARRQEIVELVRNRKLSQKNNKSIKLPAERLYPDTTVRHRDTKNIPAKKRDLLKPVITRSDRNHNHDISTPKEKRLSCSDNEMALTGPGKQAGIYQIPFKAFRRQSESITFKDRASMSIGDSWENEFAIDSHRNKDRASNDTFTSIMNKRSSSPGSHLTYEKKPVQTLQNLEERPRQELPLFKNAMGTSPGGRNSLNHPPQNVGCNRNQSMNMDLMRKDKAKPGDDMFKI